MSMAAFAALISAGLVAVAGVWFAYWMRPLPRRPRPLVRLEGPKRGGLR